MYRHKTYGIENIPPGPAIIAPNHISFYDPPLIAISCNDPVSFLAKDILFEKWPLGSIIRRLNSHPVSGTAGDLKSMKTILKLLKNKNKVIIFPEGVRTDDGKLSEVKPGVCMLAIRANVPIIPTYIHGTYEIWPRHKLLPRLSGKTRCVFGKPIYPENFRELGKKEAQKQMASTLKESIDSLRISTLH